MHASRTDGDHGYLRWKEWSRAEFGKFTAREAAVFAREVRNTGVQLTANSAVMEIGFGNGVFAGWVRDRKSRYVGTEINQELVARARLAGIEAHDAALDLRLVAAGRSFDLIAIFDVLEHLELDEILQILESATGCLAPNGRLIIRVPSGDSPFSGALMYGDITHKTRLGSKAIRQLAGLSGLDVVSIRDAAFPVLGMGPATAIRRSMVVLLRRIVGGLVKAAFFGNAEAVISPNLVGVLKPAADSPNPPAADKS